MQKVTYNEKSLTGTNDFGSNCVTYEGVCAKKKWKRIVPSWADGLMLSAAGYEAEFYMKD